MRTKYYSDHYIICGYCELGKKIAEEFISQDKSYLFIEKNKERCEQLENKNLPYVCGSAHEKDILIEAGIKKSKGIVITFSEDSEALYTVFSVKEIAPKVDIVCRAKRKETYKKLKELGVDKILMLDDLISDRMMAHIEKPSIAHSLNLLTKNDQEPILVEEVVVDESSSYINKDFGNLQETATSKVAILGLQRGGTKDFIFNPKPDTSIRSGDVLFIMGYGNEIDEMKKILTNAT